MCDANNRDKNTDYDCECNPPPPSEIPQRYDNTCSICGGDIIHESAPGNSTEKVDAVIRNKKSVK